MWGKFQVRFHIPSVLPMKTDDVFSPRDRTPKPQFAGFGEQPSFSACVVKVQVHGSAGYRAVGPKAEITDLQSRPSKADRHDVRIPPVGNITAAEPQP